MRVRIVDSSDAGRELEGREFDAPERSCAVECGAEEGTDVPLSITGSYELQAPSVWPRPVNRARMQKCTPFEQKHTGDMTSDVNRCRYALAVSRRMQGTIGNENETLSMQKREGDNQRLTRPMYIVNRQHVP